MTESDLKKNAKSNKCKFFRGKTDNKSEFTPKSSSNITFGMNLSSEMKEVSTLRVFRILLIQFVWDGEVCPSTELCRNSIFKPI